MAQTQDQCFAGDLLGLGKLLGERAVVFTAAWVGFTISPGTFSIHQDVVRGTGGMTGQRDVTEVVTCIELPHNGVGSDDTGTNVQGDTFMNPAYYSNVENTPASGWGVQTKLLVVSGLPPELYMTT